MGDTFPSFETIATLDLPSYEKYQEFRTAITAQTEAAVRSRQEIAVLNEHEKALSFVVDLVNKRRPFRAVPVIARKETEAERWIVTPPYAEWDAILVANAACEHPSFDAYRKVHWHPKTLKCDFCDKTLSFSDLVRSNADDAKRLALALDMLA